MLLCQVPYCFFNITATTEIYTLSLHDALPISTASASATPAQAPILLRLAPRQSPIAAGCASRSEEHTSELQSRFDLVCRLLLEKKKQKRKSMRGFSRLLQSLHPTLTTLTAFAR